MRVLRAKAMLVGIAISEDSMPSTSSPPQSIPLRDDLPAAGDRHGR
jgi:hypothetical protein